MSASSRSTYRRGKTVQTTETTSVVRKTKRGRMPNAKSIGWAIYAAGFAIWLFGYLSAGHAPAFDWVRPRPGGFLVSFPTSKRNSDLRSCSQA